MKPKRHLSGGETTTPVGDISRYCNSLLKGTMKRNINRLQKLKNNAEDLFSIRHVVGTTLHHYFRNCTSCLSLIESTSNFPSPCSPVTIIHLMSHHVPYGLPQRTIFCCCSSCGTHSHHIFAMPGHLDNSKDMWLFYVLGTSLGWTVFHYFVW